MITILMSALLAQVTPVQPIVKGTGLPPEGTDETAVMAPVRTLLAGIASRDGAAATSRVRRDGTLTAAIERPDGNRELRRMSWADFAARLTPGPQRYEERLLDPAVEIDGDIAMVWSPYVFLIDGKANHCGADHFDLVRRWRRVEGAERHLVATQHRLRRVTPAPTLRRAVIGDLASIVALLADDMLGAGREDTRLPLDPGYAAGFAAIEADPNQLLMVCDAEGAIVGTMQLSFIPACRGAAPGIARSRRCASPPPCVAAASARR